MAFERFSRFDKAVVAEVIDELNRNIKRLLEVLPLQIELKKEELKKLPRICPRRQNFIEQAAAYAEKNRAIIPKHTDIKEYIQLVELYKVIIEIQKILTPIVNMLQGTRRYIQAEMYDFSRALYCTAKEAKKHNIPGIEAIYKSLTYLLSLVPENENQDPGTKPNTTNSISVAISNNNRNP